MKVGIAELAQQNTASVWHSNMSIPQLGLQTGPRIYQSPESVLLVEKHFILNCTCGQMPHQLTYKICRMFSSVAFLCGLHFGYAQEEPHGA